MTMIKNLETMEKIVKKYPNLSWDGWDVVEMNRNPSAMFKVDGAFQNGKWHNKKVYSYGVEGWKIPNKYTE
jgi:hypothetical protein